MTAATQMRAAIVESPGVLRVRDIDKPAPGEYGALCEILYGSICSGTDTHIVDGVFPYPVAYPTILGHESIGRVLEVGAKVRHLKVGDLVTRVGCPAQGELSANWGGFAQFGIAHDWRAMREDGLEITTAHTVNQVVPSDFDAAAATMFITWRETFSYLSRLGARENQSVLILGSGGNGLAFAAHARNLGARAVVVGAPNRREAALASGATRLLDYRAPDWGEQLRAEFPDGFDVAIDAVGRAGGLDLALSQLKAGGVLGMYGIDDWNHNLINPMLARGSFTFYNGGYDEAEAHATIVELVRAGRLDAGVWLDLENPTPMENIGAAFERVRDRRALKALIRIGG